MAKRKSAVRKDNSPTRFIISTLGIASEFDDIFTKLSSRTLKSENVMATIIAKMLKIEGRLDKLEAKSSKPGYGKGCSEITPGEKKARRLCRIS